MDFDAVAPEANSLLRLASEGDYVARPVSPITLALGSIFFLGVALSMFSSRQRNQDFFYTPGTPEGSVARGLDRARTVMGIGMGFWGLAIPLGFLAPEPRGIGMTMILGLLSFIGFALLLVAGSVVFFNRPRLASPVKFREDQSPVARFLEERNRA